MGIVIGRRAGTYALILACVRNSRIQIGRLGRMQLQCGYYVYLGSALGPGGLRARIAHHQKLTSRPHWHIDYLRAHTRFHSVWLNYDGRRHEHEWTGAIHNMKDALVPLPGFGASDCSCPSHLYFFKHSLTQLMSMNTARLWGFEPAVGYFGCQRGIAFGGGDE
jgi:Uri superfamily endonuclease